MTSTSFPSCRSELLQDLNKEELTLLNAEYYAAFILNFALKLS